MVMVTGSCEPPNVGAENQIWVVFKWHLPVQLVLLCYEENSVSATVQGMQAVACCPPVAWTVEFSTVEDGKD